MKRFDKELLARIEALLVSYRRFVDDAVGQPEEERVVYGLRCLVNLAHMILRDVPIFGVEPWHAMSAQAKLHNAGELLLRLEDYKGNPMPPYPFIMAFYEHGFTAQLDTILVLCALRRFVREQLVTGKPCQFSINVSAQSLRDPDFVKIVLGRLEGLDLPTQPQSQIIFEIHESTAGLAISRSVLDLFRQVGCAFAIDDVGLSMNDIMRIGEFEGVADYIKLDRHCVLAEFDAPNAMANAVAFIQDMLPEAVLIAEGVQSVEHAAEIQGVFPNIDYAQGLYLPDKRAEFRVAFGAICGGREVVSS